MKPILHVAQNIDELLELLISMLFEAPRFVDRTGYLSYRNLDHTFRELHAGLNHSRPILGEERYHELTTMSDRMRTLFEADPEDKTGETVKGRNIIDEMKDILRRVPRVEHATAAFANFPYELVETSGENALATWEELKNAGRGAPVVLGEEEIHNLLFPFDPRESKRWTPVEEILAAAEAIRFPDDLFKLRRDAHAEANLYFRKIASLEDFKEEECEAPLGDWPAKNTSNNSYGMGLSVATHFQTGEAKHTVRIALIPTDDPTAIPAYMQWGNWNQCPSPAYHIAALRAWRDRYGAELIGLAADTLNLRVSRKPATREEALALTREHYFYCNDIIDQGVGSYRALAGRLMERDWWFFWWD